MDLSESDFVSDAALVTGMTALLPRPVGKSGGAGAGACTGKDRLLQEPLREGPLRLLLYIKHIPSRFICCNKCDLTTDMSSQSFISKKDGLVFYTDET